MCMEMHMPHIKAKDFQFMDKVIIKAQKLMTPLFHLLNLKTKKNRFHPSGCLVYRQNKRPTDEENRKEYKNRVHHTEKAICHSYLSQVQLLNFDTIWHCVTELYSFYYFLTHSNLSAIFSSFFFAFVQVHVSFYSKIYPLLNKNELYFIISKKKKKKGEEFTKKLSPIFWDWRHCIRKIPC